MTEKPSSSKGKTLNVDQNEIKTVIAIILLCAHCKVLYRELYWAVAPDMQNVAVPNATSQKRLGDIFSNFCLANNAEINADRYCQLSI